MTSQVSLVPSLKVLPGISKRIDCQWPTLSIYIPMLRPEHHLESSRPCHQALPALQGEKAGAGGFGLCF